jgi:hypothetical protein
MFFEVCWLVGRKQVRFAGILVFRHVRRSSAASQNQWPLSASRFLQGSDKRMVWPCAVEASPFGAGVISLQQMVEHLGLAFLSEAGSQPRVSVVPTQCLASMGSQTQSTDCVKKQNNSVAYRANLWISSVCMCLRMSADVCGCLRTRPKCLGMTCRCVCECLRPRKTAALHAVTCLRMSAEGETKEFLLLTDVCGLGDQNHPEARSKTVGFRFLCVSMPWCKYCNLSWRRNSF